MLTTEQINTFRRDGVVHVPGLVPDEIATAMGDRLWDFLETRHGLRRDQPQTWQPISGKAGYQSLTKSGVFDDVGDHLPPVITDALRTDDWERPKHWGHVLMTVPSREKQWTIPASGWHLDSHRWSVGLIPGLIAFTFLNSVRTRGGGTLVIPGSHQLTWQLCRDAGGFAPTGDMKHALAKDNPWFAELWSRESADADRTIRCMGEGTEIDGRTYKVRELTGEPGDVVLMNPRLLHVTAPNAGEGLRMMLRTSA